MQEADRPYRCYERLLNIKNHESQYPVQICLSSGMYATGAVMLKSMEDWYVTCYQFTLHCTLIYRKLCVSEDDKPPEVNCKELIKKLAEMKEAAGSSGYDYDCECTVA